MSVWKYVCGYVKINIKGLALERLINRAVVSGIRMWDVKRLADGSINASLGAADFKRLRLAARQLPCSVVILGKHGLPFAMLKGRRRPLLLWGWVLAVLIAIVGSHRLWFINIGGVSNVPESEIRMALEAFGVEVGMRRSELAVTDIGEYIRSSDSRIAWAGAALSGVVLNVSIVEANAPPSVSVVEEPRSIYADKPGVIVYMAAHTGSPAVYEGAVVAEGQLLISGALGTAETPSDVAAAGEIRARVTYTFIGTAARDSEVPVRTGYSMTYRQVELPFGIWGGQADYALSECETSVTVSGGRGILPFTYTRGICYELENAAVATVEQLEALALDAAESALAAGLPKDAGILSKSTSSETQEDGSVRVIIIIETEESIGVYGPIDRRETDGTGQD